MYQKDMQNQLQFKEMNLKMSHKNINHLKIIDMHNLIIIQKRL